MIVITFLALVATVRGQDKDATPTPSRGGTSSPNATAFGAKETKKQRSIGQMVMDAITIVSQDIENHGKSIWKKMSEWMSKGLKDLGALIVPQPQNKTM